MISRTHINIIVIFLFFIALSIALYLRRPKDTWEPKWCEGLISCSENAYYNNNILAIIQKWTEAMGEINKESDIFYHTLLVIDLDENAIWLEKEGNIIEDYYIEFPEKVKFEIVHFSQKDLSLQKGRIIFRNVDDKTVQASSEQFTLHSLGNSYKLNFSIIDTRKGVFQVKGLWPSSTKATINVEDIVSPLIVTKEEYEQYINSLTNTDTLHNGMENIQSHILTELEENQAAWKKIGKKLFIEIEKQVHKAGYELTSLRVLIDSDFNSSNASITGYNNNPVIEILDKSPYVNTYLGIIRLKDDIWYVASKPEPKKKRNERTMKLEFLIYTDSDISPSQAKEYINQGRKEFKKHLNDLN